MKKKFAVVLALVVMLFMFTGCELAPSLPEILTTVKGYNDEIIAAILPHMENMAPESFVQDSLMTINNEMFCIVSSSDSNELDLSVTLENWVASDGTEINGFVELDFYYYDDPVYISSIETYRAMFNFDRTSVVFEAEVFDGDAATSAFTFHHATFSCSSLLVDGESLISTNYNK